MAVTAEQRAQRAAALRPLFAYMDQWGVKRTWLADKLNISRSTLWSYEHGRYGTPAWFVKDACVALGVTPERLGWVSTRATTSRRTATRKAS